MNETGNSTLLRRRETVHAIWRQAFRPFFLAGAMFSVVAMGAWAAALGGWWGFSPFGGVVFWHAHEMVFGFVAAIIVGFLLTAVQNWTGLRSTHGRPLMALFILWLAARLLMLRGPEQMPWVSGAVDVGFLPAACGLLGYLVIKARNYGNLQFIPVLLLLAGANLCTHLSVGLHQAWLYHWGIYTAVMIIALLMVVMGGRVIPLFTASGTQTPAVVPLPWLERTVLVSAWLIALLYAVNCVDRLPPPLLATLFAVAALGNALRALRWWVRPAMSYPLVWSLHLAYWFIPVGFALFALRQAGVGLTASTGLHGLTAGAMGSLVLAMIARVSLGHTGRPLVVHPIMKYAFLCVALAAISRLLIGIYPALATPTGYLATASFWMVAYGIYCVLYAGILTTPRADGKPG